MTLLNPLGKKKYNPSEADLRADSVESRSRGNASPVGIDARVTKEISRRHSVSIPQIWGDLSDPHQTHSPLARQFCPDIAELTTLADEGTDPIGDELHTVSPRLVHRYPDRVLLKVSDACAAYCRFCFRREMVEQPDKSGRITEDELRLALRYIAQNQDIHEVILTGGDPLVLSFDRVAAILSGLNAIEHLDWLRIHSRVPIVRPDLISDKLVQLMSCSEKPLWLSVHVNHADELQPECCDALARLAGSGVQLISQTVLLRGVNDDAETLRALFRKLVRCKVKPYYLHHMDRAPGTSHFRVSLAKGQALMQELRATLSGLAQPNYVLDIPGGYGKIPAGKAWVTDRGDGCYSLTDLNGQPHDYRDQE